MAGDRGVSELETAELEVSHGEALPVDEHDEHEQAIDAEDVEPLRVAASPDLPSRSEIEKHRVDHWPPRTWCDECVEGFGRERGHFRKPDTETHGPIVSFDYMFLKKTGEYGECEEDVADGGIKILVVKDSKSKAIFAHVVPQKGIDPKRYVVDMIVEDVFYLGYNHVLLKTDNEKADTEKMKEELEEALK